MPKTTTKSGIFSLLRLLSLWKRNSWTYPAWGFTGRATALSSSVRPIEVRPSTLPCCVPGVGWPRTEGNEKCKIAGSRDTQTDPNELSISYYRSFPTTYFLHRVFAYLEDFYASLGQQLKRPCCLSEAPFAGWGFDRFIQVELPDEAGRIAMAITRANHLGSISLLVVDGTS